VTVIPVGSEGLASAVKVTILRSASTTSPISLYKLRGITKKLYDVPGTRPVRV
jgi:hypothetical protein